MTKPGENLRTAWEVAMLIILDMHFYNLNNLLHCYNTYDMYLKIMCDFFKVIICRDILEMLQNLQVPSNRNDPFSEMRTVNNMLTNQEYWLVYVSCSTLRSYNLFDSIRTIC